MSQSPIDLMRVGRERSIAGQVQTGDTVTRYWKYPASQAGAKALVFIHGYRGNHHGLEAIAGALPEFDIYIPDLPGFGKSTPFAGQHSIDEYQGWVGKFIAALKLENKPTLLGHSFGTIVCAAHAAYSDDFSELILVNPVSAPALSGPKAAMTRVAKAFFSLAATLPAKTGESILKSWPMVRGMSIVMTKSRNRTLRAWVHAQHDENFNDFASRKVAIEGYTASISHNVGDYSRDFKKPTLLIAGELDDITTPAQQRTMMQTIPVETVLKMHAGVGHLTHYEIPAMVAADIRDFLGGRP